MQGVYRIAGHGADCVIHLYADTPEEVFRLAARAVAATSRTRAAQAAKSRGGEERRTVEARDLPALLVDWINELIASAEIHGRPWICTDLRLGASDDGARLEAVIAPLDTPWSSPLKAATLHDLRFEKRGKRWHASVVCDL